MEKPFAVTDPGIRPVAAPLLKAVRAWGGRFLKQPPTPTNPVAVALSGGADSVALLLAAHQVWPGAVIALHVNHGLQVAATQFAAVCRVLCSDLGLPLRILTVQVAHEPGASLEAQARQVRYAALADAAVGCKAQVVLLGHHADDQAETVLLALTRGAGLPGLSAMGGLSTKGGVAFGRPFLALRAAALRECVRQCGVAFSDDPTNWDQRHTRNRIRHSVLPDLIRHFPAVVDTLARTARHAAEASGLLDELALADLATVGIPPRLKDLQALSRARQANVLRHWLKICAGAAPSTAQMDELLGQVAHCTTRGHAIAIKVSAGQVCRVGAELHYRPDSRLPGDAKCSVLAPLRSKRSQFEA
jgi:tRNA(Ile)-lysidine synthase